LRETIDMQPDEVRELNRVGWNRRVEARDIWTRPVSPGRIRRARAGEWSVVLTPNKPTPREWFGDIAGKDVLCLASGGGQQGPVLAAAGARVVVFDASSSQLSQDDVVAQRDGLSLTTVQGFMHDLSAFTEAQFDLIFHPVSNLYSPDILSVWTECHRVLRPGGILLAGFVNPMVYIFDTQAEPGDDMVVKFALPYSDVVDRPPEMLREMIERDHTVEFSHTLEEQIGGQLAAGFVLTHMFEDRDLEDRESGPTGRSRYFPTCMATRAVKT
jgi:2-polyprenyl-3-methyl-5-hydroxy-6-metoxy-1,4-benzoquinol methylase